MAAEESPGPRGRRPQRWCLGGTSRARSRASGGLEELFRGVARSGIWSLTSPRPPAIEPLGTITTAAAGVTVTSIVGAGHCSQLVLRISVDGQKVGGTFKLNAGGLGSVSFEVATGRPHKLGFVEQGFVGGCNSGLLVSVSG